MKLFISTATADLDAEYPISAQFAAESYAYHISADFESVKKLGLCSPGDLFNKDRIMFHKTSFRIYEDRAKRYLRKSSVTDEDILKYLDGNERAPFTSKCIFFAFIENAKMPHIVLGDRCELKIPLETIEKYAAGEPIIVLGPAKTQTTWDELKRNYASYMRKAETGAKQEPKSVLKYAKITHFAVDCNPIPSVNYSAV